MAQPASRGVVLCALSTLRSLVLLFGGVLMTLALLRGARGASYLITLGVALLSEALGWHLLRLAEAPLREELGAVIEENHRLAEAVLALDGSEANLRLVRGGGR